MENRKNSMFLQNAISEWRRTTGNADTPLDGGKMTDIVFNWHPYRYIEQMPDKGNRNWELTQDFIKCYNEYIDENLIINEFKDLYIRKCKFVKKFIDIFFVTISPPPDIKPNKLVEFVKKLSNRKNRKFIYGVFERGTTSNNFHCHFLYTPNPEAKDEKINLKKCIENTKWIMDFKKLPCKMEVLKCLRYMHKENKKNEGFICMHQSRDFLELVEDTADIKFVIKKDAIYI